MKRVNHARLVGIGRESAEVVDKPGAGSWQRGAAFTKRDLIEAQLRGDPHAKMPFESRGVSVKKKARLNIFTRRNILRGHTKRLMLAYRVIP